MKLERYKSKFNESTEQKTIKDIVFNNNNLFHDILGLGVNDYEWNKPEDFLLNQKGLDRKSNKQEITNCLNEFKQDKGYRKYISFYKKWYKVVSGWKLGFVKYYDINIEKFDKKVSEDHKYQRISDLINRLESFYYDGSDIYNEGLEYYIEKMEDIFDTQLELYSEIQKRLENMDYIWNHNFKDVF